MNNNTVSLVETGKMPHKWNLQDKAGIADFIEAFQMTTSNDQDLLAGLVLMLKEIRSKKDLMDVEDYCDTAIRSLFTWHSEFDKAQDDFLENVKTLHSYV